MRLVDGLAGHRSADGSGRASVEIGLTAPRTTSGSPFVTPPVSPPALFVRWTHVPSPPGPR
jgi:hypothetical protein